MIFAKSESVDVSKINVNKVQVANNDNGNIGDNIYGNTESKVTLINYSNFQCSGCVGYYQNITKPLTEQYKDKIKFINRYRNLSYLQNGKAAQGTAEAAGLQGKFWEMHDKLFDDQDGWSRLSGTDRTKYFKKLAKDLGLDTKKFIKDLESDEVNDKINYDDIVASKAGVTETPMFFLNGVKLGQETAGDIAKFKAAIEAELKK